MAFSDCSRNQQLRKEDLWQNDDKRMVNRRQTVLEDAGPQRFREN
jgi:hypothetical protein